MPVDVVIAIAAALVAIFGTVYDPKEALVSQIAVGRICDLRRWSWDVVAPRILITLALGICGFAIWKSIKDDREKDFMKAAITETLPPTPEVINQIYLDMQQLVKGQYAVSDYTSTSAGLVLFLENPDESRRGKEPPENIVFSTSDLARLRANMILREDTSIPLRLALNRSYNFSTYDEDLYSRLCALLSASSRRALFKKPVDCDYDGDRGITLTVNVRNVEQQVVFSVDEIKGYEGQEAKAAFGKMGDIFRNRVAELNR